MKPHSVPDVASSRAMRHRAGSLSIGLAVAILLLPSTAWADDYPRQPAVDVLHYEIEIELPAEGQGIRETTRILFEAREPVSTVALNLLDLEVGRVLDGEREVPWRTEQGWLEVKLAPERARGERFQLSVEARGEPRDGLIIGANRHGNPTIFADNWPDRARHWFPCIDHPYDKATVAFRVIAPSRYDVVANGDRKERTYLGDDRTLTRYETAVPMPTYCMVIGVMGFAVVDGGDLPAAPACGDILYFLYPEDRDAGIRDLARAAEMVRFLARRIGPYPFESLALVQSRTRFGGMENASAIFFAEDAFRGDGRVEGTLAHEIAHQWFGDSVTIGDWDHLWLSEGFATYFGHLFFEEAEGRGAFLHRMQQAREAWLRQSRSLGPVIDARITNLLGLLNANNYQKGAWVLHMLRGLAGDERFFAGVREYYRRFAGGTVLTADFEEVMEEGCGMDLDWFFDQWLERPGCPRFRGEWSFDEEEGTVEVRLEQIQEEDPFRTPLTIRIEEGEGFVDHRVEVREREEMFVFEARGRPSAVGLDPDGWVLMTMQMSGAR